jgi:flagellar hook-associated protein 1 FlgK
MGLSFALSTALSGLRATQTGIEVVSANTANARTPGYTKKSTVLDASVLGGRSAGVKVTNIQREIDTYVQRQLRTESSGLSFSNVASTYIDRLQRLFGTPGSEMSLDSLVSNFTGALDALATTPSSQSARQGVLTEAQLFTQSLNSMSADIQSMRQDADRGLASTTQQINAALKGIEKVQTQIDAMAVTGGGASPDLLDQRDRFVNELSDLVDIRVGDSGSDFSIYTTGGATLFANHTAATLEYTGPVAMSPQTSYSEDPAQNNAGTVLLHAPGSAAPVDLLADGKIRSGQLKAYAEIRDNVLVEAQTQLDELAASMAEALGTNTVAGIATGAGGFSLDVAGVKAGNKISVTYNEMPGGQPRTVTFVRTDDPTTLPLSNDLTADPKDRVVGIDFSGGPASVAAQMQAALGGDFAVSNTGSTVTFGAATANVAMTGANARVTATGFTDGLGIPLFVDGTVPYTGSIDGVDQRLGFSGRIKVNPALFNDPALLVNYPTSTSVDPARATFLRDALENAQIQYRTDTGIGGATSPFTGSIADFARNLIETQASNADIAARVQEGQEVVVISLQDRFAEKAAVDPDEEMGKLLQLQSAYAANARVISTVKEMIDVLLNM